MSTATPEVAPCRRCASALEAEDLRCPICGLMTPPRAHGTVERETAKVVRCENCGASVEYSVEAKAPRCDYCGSVTRVETTVDPVEQAQAYLPFTVDPEAARAALMGFLGKGGFFRPSGLAREASVESMRPLWWPAWSFRAGVDVSWTADSDAGARRSDWAPHAGRTRFDFDDIIVPASRGLKVKECEALAPHYRRDTEEREPRGPEGANIERFEATRSGARRTVLETVERLSRERLQQGVIPGRRFRNVHVAVALSSLYTTRLALPVYVLAYRYRDKAYRVLVHGQEAGAVFGEAPISKWRVAAVVAGVLLLVLVALLATGVLGS
ncbi:zinc ribbon domain-containing protein [Pyxidicoccus fallax]|uniref:Zinc ribbon domain-containing protein n=1 Tax=Pyxidicoccus fallax TaxID=394095 RepID=A0A848LRM3_9BACT|nr:zinc ribbon domain-containing protein [Pyxidicoccus fallax]NMO20578.1 zinc ribbon domain-containing protein [Pyxidicoccus fallax]NPC84856.1 zinc ribbon domain-containing protein [Pyxidicoccus fallax]